MSQDLNILDFTLHGSRLIEASAGTGKTYTIAALYVRLVLQHGAELQAFHRALLPKDILVMTFTRAATAELADRIRARLSEAASYFRAENGLVADEFLQNLKNDYLQRGCSAAELAYLARRLELAAESMDESAVHTINGWCQKMLTEHAFASGSLFEQEVKTEEDDLKLIAAEEYFRRNIYTLNYDFAQQVLDCLRSPAHLSSKMRGENFSSDDAEINHRFKEMLDKLELISKRPDKYTDISKFLKEITPTFPKTGYSNLAGIIEKLYKWADRKIDANALGANIKLLKPESLIEKLSKIPSKIDYPSSIEILADLEKDLREISDIHANKHKIFLEHAKYFATKRFQELKLQAAQMGFDDMLTRLRDALRGKNGQQLAQTIRQQFPVALVDEFQDTDPIQYEIFDTIYHIKENDPTTGIFLIGDPKQAIYSFRNADIFTYLKARQATEGRHYNLKKNFRSSQRMVDAVNRLFTEADNKSERGAFLYKTEIPFAEVAANGQQKVFKGLDGEEAAALQWHIAKEPAATKEAYQKAAARFHANLIAQLLNSDKAGFYHGDERTPITTRDIAVLVATAKEAQLIRDELRKCSIRSVYLSENDSVFSQPVAKDLLAVVQACAQPRDPARIRTALAVPLLAEPLAKLIEYQENELAWEAAVERFIGYHEIWERFGVLAALTRLLHDFKVPARLLADANEGERQLADTLHLCELLQQESMRLEGMASLEEYFALQVQEYKAATGNSGDTNKRTNTEALQLRLESDEDLVKVITYHKSKGLQYPLVFMPFPAYTTESQHRFKEYKFPQSYHKINEKGDRERHIAWSKDDAEALALIKDEMLAEDLRKMYVALTRAEFATFVTLQAVGEPQQNALFYLLYRGATVTKAETNVLDTARKSWQPNEAIHTSVTEMPAAEAPQKFLLAKQNEQSLQARSLDADVKRSAWWITSYSALNYGSDLTTPETAAQMNLLEGAREEPATEFPVMDNQSRSAIPSTTSVNMGLIHHIPKGAAAGTFLHTLLEDAAEAGFAAVAFDQSLRQNLLEARCNSPFWQPYQQVLDSWLQQYLTTRFNLSDDNLALSDLQIYKAEPEFWFETRQVSTQRLDKLIAKYIQPEHERPKLDSATLNGMLKGFIDLVFEYKGKYYVADYKSNWLGDQDSAYHTDAMRQKILASRYDLQYVIYTLALHKLLKQRLGSHYDYDRHIGGAVYLFLRGYSAQSKGAFFDRPPRELIEALERECLAQGAQGEAHV